jgi:hypothetical protein
MRGSGSAREAAARACELPELADPEEPLHADRSVRLAVVLVTPALQGHGDGLRAGEGKARDPL